MKRGVALGAVALAASLLVGCTAYETKQQGACNKECDVYLFTYPVCCDMTAEERQALHEKELKRRETETYGKEPRVLTVRF